MKSASRPIRPGDILPSPRGTRSSSAEGQSEIGAEKSDGRSEQMDARYMLRVLGEEGEGQRGREAERPIISVECRSGSGKSSHRFRGSSQGVCSNVR